MKDNKKNKEKGNENIAKAVAKDVGISTKMAVEVCSLIRNKKLEQAKNILKKVIEKKQAVPFKRYNKHLAHKTKIGPGRYPEKASKEILKLLEQAEANAQFKGLSTADLIILHIKADKASTPWHFGRKRRRKMKRTHVEVVVKEKIEETKKEEKVEKSEEKKEEKVEEKPKEELKKEKVDEKKAEEKKQKEIKEKEEKKADKK